MTNPTTPAEINVAIAKICTKCRQEKPRTEFYSVKNKPNSVRPMCKACESKRQKSVPADLQREYARRWRKKHPEKSYLKNRRNQIDRKDTYKKDPIKSAARRKVRSAVEAGFLVRPKNCSKCGREAKTQAHHHDYLKPLEVNWLCGSCHGKEHLKPAPQRCSAFLSVKQPTK